MTARLTDAELDELERREHPPGRAELFPSELASLLAEVREMRSFEAAIYEAAGMLELPDDYAMTEKDRDELAKTIDEWRTKSVRVGGYRERLAAALEDDDRVIAGGGDLDGALHEAAEHARRGGFDAAIFGKEGE